MDNTNKTLHELCDSIGVSRRAIQGYEKAGLVSASGRNKYGHLLYDENAQKRVAQVKMYQGFGFTLKEIKALMDAPNLVLKAALEQQVLHMKTKQAQIEVLIQKACDLIDTL